MDRDYIEREIKAIADIAADDESAHSREDRLRAWFIWSLSQRTDEIGELAKLILTTDKIDFARWCA